MVSRRNNRRIDYLWIYKMEVKIWAVDVKMQKAVAAVEQSMQNTLLSIITLIVPIVGVA